MCDFDNDVEQQMFVIDQKHRSFSMWRRRRRM